MNFMFCCIDVNYVRNPKQEVNIFGLREKESREVEIFTSTITYIFATILYMCVCLKKNCTSQTCLSDLSYKCQDRSTFDALSPGEGPHWCSSCSKFGLCLTLMDAGFGDLIWGGRGATI